MEATPADDGQKQIRFMTSMQKADDIKKQLLILKNEIPKRLHFFSPILVDTGLAPWPHLCLTLMSFIKR